MDEPRFEVGETVEFSIQGMGDEGVVKSVYQLDSVWVYKVLLFGMSRQREVDTFAFATEVYRTSFAKIRKRESNASWWDSAEAVESEYTGEPQ